MGKEFHFDFSAVWAIFTFLLGVVATAAAYYVKTQAKAAANSGVEAATNALTTRLEQLAAQLFGKVDGLREAISAVNVTLGRSEERTDQNTREISRLESRAGQTDDRLSRAEQRIEHLAARNSRTGD